VCLPAGVTVVGSILSEGFVQPFHLGAEVSFEFVVNSCGLLMDWADVATTDGAFRAIWVSLGLSENLGVKGSAFDLIQSVEFTFLSVCVQDVICWCQALKRLFVDSVGWVVLFRVQGVNSIGVDEFFIQVLWDLVSDGAVPVYSPAKIRSVIRHMGGRYYLQYKAGVPG
jgi:hypothetical protein